MGRYLELAKEAMREIEAEKVAKSNPFTPTAPSSRQEIKAAMTRLEFGECRAVRLYSHTCKGQFLILSEDEIPESITVDCPTFTLKELKKLIGSDSDHIKAVYQLKQVFGAKVVDI